MRPIRVAAHHALIAICLLPVVTHAQPLVRQAREQPQRKGFNFAVSSGMSVSRTTCDRCSIAGSGDGDAGFFRIGYAIDPQIVVGVEALMMATQGADSHASGTASVYIQYYPNPTGRMHAVTSFGSGFMDGLSGGRYYLAKGPAFGLGVGYDVPLSRRMAITPWVSYVAIWRGELSIDWQPTDARMSARAVALGTSITLP